MPFSVAGLILLIAMEVRLTRNSMDRKATIILWHMMRPSSWERSQKVQSPQLNVAMVANSTIQTYWQVGNMECATLILETRRMAILAAVRSPMVPQKEMGAPIYCVSIF